MSEKDGGPAFPQAVAMATGEAPKASYDFVDGSGMSLRDYFAAKALQGLVETLAPGQNIDGAETYADYAAKAAYLHADAMLRAREAT